MGVAVGLACLDVALFIVLRYFIHGTVALVLAQVVYIAVPVIGAVLASHNAAIAPSGSRARPAWVLVSFTLAMLAIAECGYAWGTLSGSDVDPVGGLSDIAAALATIGFVGIIGVLAGIDRLGRRRALRAVLDVAAISTLAFVIAFNWWIAQLGTSLPETDFTVAVRLAVYVSVGVLVLAGDVVVLEATRRGTRIDQWAGLLAAGIAVYGFAVVAWPAWSLATMTLSERLWIEPATTMTFLVGYVLLTLSAASRTIHREDSWRIGRAPVVRRSAWPSVASATLVLVSVAVIGVMLTRAPRDSREAAVYAAALIITTLCLVGRTALSADEVLRLSSAAGTDAITGAYNRRLLEERTTTMLLTAQRFGEPFCLAVVDLDDMNAVNQEFGSEVGDEVLAAVASGFARIVGAPNVFRVGGDEFAVVMSCDGRSGARAAASLLADTVARVDTVPTPLSASVGYVLCADGTATSDELLGQASTAVLWAKNHGKHQVVEFDPRMVRGSLDRHDVSWIEAPAQQQVARALLGLVGSGDVTGPRHARNVAVLSVLLAEDLGLPSDEVDRLELAALVHDVGTLALEDSTVRDGGRMRSRAYEEHAELGALFVDSLGLEDVTAIVKAHHERWDGEGFPDALKHDEVPLGARIVALADAYDRLTTGGKGSPEMSKAAALQEIDLGLGTRFDPVVGERFIRAVGSTSALGWADQVRSG